ncbi:hypothetical protein [Micromonospora aurantiaca (nom. illeg.)]|uniref:hypothetical protein n=1 Tax=Micromonospora aurantiaca (nom. illeg.) TaxID=47850 RepID=UPI001656D469|nr:hypothetical protein [Micromonospora aurantiaca]MBC9003853.1 hypothetical protein [Micromonospora aurantiaca]
MQREKRVMLGCPPTNINELLEGMGVPPFVPTVEHSLAQCEDCGTDVWIGPNQRAARARAPQATLVVCMACGLIEQAKRGGGAVGHLGGGGGRPRLPG